MSSSWVFLALSSTVISSLINLLDSHFITRRIPGWRAYVLICDLFTLPASLAMLFIFPLPAGIGLPTWLAIFGSAMAVSVASILILNAMKSEEVSRISPLTSTSPVFVAIFAMLFLSEALSLQQWLAIVAVVTGVIVISLKWKTGRAVHFHARPVLLLSAASLFIAIGAVTNKYALGYMSYWNSAALIFLISSIVFIAICLRRETIRQITSLENRGAAIALALTGQVVAMAASVLSYWAVQLGPVAMVSTIYSSKPVFVFVFSSLVGRLSPNFMLHERGSRNLTLIRLAGTLLVASGLIAMLV